MAPAARWTRLARARPRSLHRGGNKRSPSRTEFVRVPTQQVGGFEVDRGSDPHHRSFANGDGASSAVGFAGVIVVVTQSFTIEGGMSMRILWRVPLRRRALLVAGATALAGASVAAASTLTAGAVVRVPDKPLGGSPACADLVAQQTAAGSVNYPDSEVEPYVAVDPTNPTHLIDLPAGPLERRRRQRADQRRLHRRRRHVESVAGQPAFTIC